MQIPSAEEMIPIQTPSEEGKIRILTPFVGARKGAHTLRMQQGSHDYLLVEWEGEWVQIHIWIAPEGT